MYAFCCFEEQLLHFLQKTEGPYRKTSMGSTLCSCPVLFMLHTLLNTLNLRRVVKWLVTLHSWNVLRHKLSIITQQTVCCSVLVPTGYTVLIFRNDARGIRKHCWTSCLNAGWGLQGLCGEGYLLWDVKVRDCVAAEQCAHTCSILHVGLYVVKL